MARLSIIGGLFAVLLIAAALLWHSAQAVVGELVADVNGGDTAAFAARIDFPALRDFLKEDIAANKKGAGALGAQVGPDLSQVGPIVDYFVQPENIDVVFYQRDSLFRDIPPEAFIDSTGYAPPFGFSMTFLAWPKTGKPLEDVTAGLRDRMKVRFVFRIDGGRWKITEMHVPLFMVPQQTLGAPLPKLYGRPAK